ncbi:MAG: addiction module toxin RelE, partial [Rhodospirillaceae bacterium]|nr:addiction module toxin RelE [Rhodospirillaceae bacterium]
MKRLFELVETKSYAARADKLLSPAERLGIEFRISSEPTCGALIAGAGGVRKVRVGRGSQGKSGGAR